MAQRQCFFWRGGGGARAPPSGFFEILRGGVPPREISVWGGRGGRVVHDGDVTGVTSGVTSELHVTFVTCNSLVTHL